MPLFISIAMCKMEQNIQIGNILENKNYTFFKPILLILLTMLHFMNQTKSKKKKNTSALLLILN